MGVCLNIGFAVNTLQFVWDFFCHVECLEFNLHKSCAVFI